MKAYQGRVAAVVLIVLSVWEVATLVAAKRSAPTDADWQAASTIVRRDFQRGDLIVFAPAWMDPVGRKWLGDLITVHDAARLDDVRYARVWEVSARGAHAATGFVKVDERSGALMVRLFERTVPTVTWDLRARSELYEVGFEPHECAILRPEPGRPAHLEISAAQLGGSLAVVAGLADFRSRRDNRATALLKVLVDDAEVSKALIENESGWLALPTATTLPGVHRVVFEASVAKPANPTKLELCVAAEARMP